MSKKADCVCGNQVRGIGVALRKGQPQDLQKGICILEPIQEKNTFFITHQNIYQGKNLYLQVRKSIRIFMLYFYYYQSKHKNIHRTICKNRKQYFQSILEKMITSTRKDKNLYRKVPYLEKKSLNTRNCIVYIFFRITS